MKIGPPESPLQGCPEECSAMLYLSRQSELGTKMKLSTSSSGKSVGYFCIIFRQLGKGVICLDFVFDSNLQECDFHNLPITNIPILSVGTFTT